MMNSFILILTGIFGACITFYFSHHLKQGSVRASALLSLIVGLFFYCFPDLINTYLTQNIPVVFIGASFIGMGSFQAKGNYLKLIIAGFFFSLLYINKNYLLEDYGGSLGALALISILASFGFWLLFSKTRKKLLENL